MDHFLDEAARILASPVSRRQAFRRIGTAALAGVAGLLWAGEAGAQATCTPACKQNQQCCAGYGGGKNHCENQNVFNRRRGPGFYDFPVLVESFSSWNLDVERIDAGDAKEDVGTNGREMGTDVGTAVADAVDRERPRERQVAGGVPAAFHVRPPEEAERFARVAHAVEARPSLSALEFRDPELLHYLVIHKMQHERLRAAGATIGVPDARFGALRTGTLFRRFEPALFQARVPGTTLWDMFDFDAVRIKPEWRQSLRVIASHLGPLLDSPLAEHIDWNIRNFVFDAQSARLFYVDMKPTTFVPRYSNEHNIQGIHRYFISPG